MTKSSDRRLHFWLQVAASCARKRANKELKPLGLSMPQLAALFVIRSRDVCVLKDLASALYINASAVTTLADRLKARGMISVEKMASDGRASVLSLTATGEAAVGAALPRMANMNTRLGEAFSPEELDIVQRFLTTVVAFSQEDGDDQ